MKEGKMLRELSRKNRVSLCMGLFIVAALTFAAAGRSVLAAASEDDDSGNVFYAMAVTSPGMVELWQIQVKGSKVTTTDIGPTHVGCATLATSPSGTLMSMCFETNSNLFGDMQLTTFDTKTGNSTPIGVTVTGLAIMAMAFGKDGTLYVVGGCKPVGDPADCDPTDPGFNTLYTVNQSTGELTRIGSTGAPEYFMDLAVDRHGTLWGVTSCLSPCYAPAVLYTIDPTTGKATKVVNMVGSSTVMGLSFAPNGKLYATDFTGNPGLYLVDPKTGFETAIAALPFTLTAGLDLVEPLH
jgi:hypothetical protein